MSFGDDIDDYKIEITKHRIGELADKHGLTGDDKTKFVALQLERFDARHIGRIAETGRDAEAGPFFRAIAEILDKRPDNTSSDPAAVTALRL